jgi:predicted ester cyclase
MKKLLMILPLALILCFMFACQDKEAMAELEAMKAQAEVEEQNKELVLQFYNALDGQDYEKIDGFMSDDIILQYAGSPDPIKRESIIEFVRYYYNAFPDNTHNVEEFIAKGDKVIALVHQRATHKGEYEGIQPTGIQVDYYASDIWRVVEGKIVEAWVVEDNLSLMMQLGMELKPKEGEK